MYIKGVVNEKIQYRFGNAYTGPGTLTCIDGGGNVYTFALFHYASAGVTIPF